MAKSLFPVSCDHILALTLAVDQQRTIKFHYPANHSVKQTEHLIQCQNTIAFSSQCVYPETNFLPGCIFKSPLCVIFAKHTANWTDGNFYLFLSAFSVNWTDYVPNLARSPSWRNSTRTQSDIPWYHTKWWKPHLVLKTGVVFKNSNGWFWQTSNCNTVTTLQAIFFDLIRRTVVYFSFLEKRLYYVEMKYV